MRLKPFLSFRGNKLCNRALQIALISTFFLIVAGCNSLTQNPGTSTTSSTSRDISLQSTLPIATLSKPYNAILSVSGGQAPYAFAVSAGKLPPGLSLTSTTGGLSGNPTEAGEFAFTISVEGNNAQSSGRRSYSLTVDPCTTCASVQISPLSPSVAPGEKQQFAATVTNTSNSAVTWSVSGGSITNSGMFTAPANGSSKTITVTASSVAQPAAQASTTVSLASVESLKIDSSSIPSATVGTPYDAQLTASGGTAPYQWNILSGSLPSGLQLSANSGIISGTTTQSGTYSLIVNVADAGTQTAQQSLTLPVSNPSGSCGPPHYCSRSDSKTAQTPGAVPSVGNLVGANRVVTDPDFGNTIVRITDWNTDPGLPDASRSFVSASSGSADENLWNVNSSLLVVQSIGDASYPYTFTPSTLQAARMYVASFPDTGGLKISGPGNWSRVDPNLLYTTSGSGIYKYDFADRKNPPTPQLVYDFKESHHCLPAGFSAAWRSKGGVSDGDAVFGMAYASGIQGTGIYAVAYHVGKGCSILNTQTGEVTGDWGATGTINIPDRWTIHNVKLSKDGDWLIVAPQTCLISNCSKGPYFWQIGTTNVSSCGDGKHCSGHWTEGYNHWVNNNDTMNQVMRPLPEVKTVQELTGILPSGLQAPLDEHLSWNNADPGDSLPFFITTWSPIRPFPTAFYNEIIGVAPDGSGKIWRFAHNFITSRSQNFSTTYGIGSVSQDGRFFVFSSDWMGTLGSQSGRSNCTVGENCRGDVFVVRLN